jgi:hypothetical protein
MRNVRAFFLLLGMGLFTLAICSQDLKITRMGEWGSGQYRDVFVQGNYAYCAATYSGLHIIDIGDASRPRKVGHYDACRNAIGVYTNGNYSYVLDEEMGLLIIDISSPSAPHRVGFYANLNLDHFKGYIHVGGEYAYIVDLDGLHVIDVSTSSTPLRVGYSPLKGMYGLMVNDRRAYASYKFGFYIFDVSNPLEPELMGTYENRDFECSGDIFVNGHYAYLMGWDTYDKYFGFQVIDISDPSAPNRVGDALGAGIRNNIYVKDNYAYVTTAWASSDRDVNSTVEVYDVSDPSTPAHVGSSARYYGTLIDIFVKDNYVYTANGYSGLQVFAVSHPFSLNLTGSCQTFQRLESVYIKGQYAFIADYYTGLVILDISNPSYPVRVGYLETPGNAMGIFVKGSHAYVADNWEGLQIIDISDPSAPVSMGGFDTGKALGVFIDGHYAYVAGGSGGLKIVDISNPSTPSLAGEYDRGVWLEDVFVSGNHAYLAESIDYGDGYPDDTGGGFEILDISDPSAPVPVGKITTDVMQYARDVYAQGAYAYVVNRYTDLNIIDISVPSSPTLVGNYPSAEYGEDVFCSGNYAYLACGSNGLQIVDIGSPSEPRLTAGYTNIGRMVGVVVSGNYIYAIDKDGGKFYILHANDNHQPAQLILSRTGLYFGSSYNGISTGTQTLFVRNSGGGEMEWSVSPGQEWLKCGPSSGINNGEIFVSVDAIGLSPGIYHGSLSVSSPQAANSPQTVAVTLEVHRQGKTSMPFGAFATPLDGSVAMGSIPVTGWVLDDIGVRSVKIYREEGSALVYIGDAVMVEGARPDVELAFPDYPQNDRAGWGYMLLTNFLPAGGNGTFSLHAVATDFEGYQVILGSKTIYCDNAGAVKPFGAIDTPPQGGIVGGSGYVNFGWALTPLPNTIPEDGSTITVWVDGVPLGHPVYNQYRADIAALFPGYNNSDGAVGYYYLDTTQYESGVHTIAWSVEDNAGNIDGIGSRYFTISNQGQTNSQTHPAAFGLQSIVNIDPYQIPVDDFQPIYVRKGYKQGIEPQVIYPDDGGNIMIETRELERVEIHLSHPSSNDGPRRMNISYIPIGAAFDRERGIFSWQPGPGYLGDYELVFIEKIGDEIKRKLIIVRIKPQSE